MRRVVLLLVLVSLVACKKKSGEPAKAAPDAAVAKAPPPDAAAPRPGHDLSKAPTPEPATAEDCKLTGEWSAQLMTIVATDRGVPPEKVKEVGKALGERFTEMCGTDQWPPNFLDCVGKGKVESFTWQRCQARLPAEKLIAWNAIVDEAVGKAGGTVEPGTQEPPPEGGVAFEELCADFWAELVRFDDCASSGMYVPDLENVLIAGRSAAVGGLIPPDRQDNIRKICDRGYITVREVEATVCGKAVK